MIDLKKCLICNQTLSINKFLKKKSKPDGHNNICKMCKPPNGYKICYECDKIIIKSCFFKNKSTTDGYGKYCKSCIKKYINKHSSTKTVLEKTCSYCKKIKPINEFNKLKSEKDGNSYFCKPCFKLISIKYKEKKALRSKIYYLENKNILNTKNNISYSKNKDKVKQRQKVYYSENKDIIRMRKRKYNSKRLKNKEFSLRSNISRSIRFALKNNGFKKSGSVLNFLPYKIIELKNHLESLFESWMNWDNYGNYRLNSWNDSDQSTWKWNIDHIIPQSMFNYDSMNHPDFFKCRALENLRPLSAKENLLKSNKMLQNSLSIR